MKPAFAARGLCGCPFSLFAALAVACLLPISPMFAAESQATAAADPDLLERFESDQDVTNSLGMVLIWVPAGYRVAQYEVTQAEYQQVMGENPSRFQDPRRPVEQVSWNQAREFCRKLTESERSDGHLPDGYSYALPTQAQWRFYVADAELEDAITSHLGDRRRSEPVGGLRPNLHGLYDVRGNVWEWCSEPVARGASWRSHEDFLDIDFRYVATPDAVYDDIGFRVILQPVGTASDP